jgi:hypothetical protein
MIIIIIVIIITAKTTFKTYLCTLLKPISLSFYKTLTGLLCTGQLYVHNHVKREKEEKGMNMKAPLLIRQLYQTHHEV